MKDNEITLCGVTAQAGEKARGFAVVPGSDIKIPLVIINGERPGPLLLLTAGIHAAEYPGIAALSELGRKVVPCDIAGVIVMLYPVNLQGFWQRCDFIVPEDGKNLNRVFPGSPSGTLAERTAWLLTNEFFPHADFYADLHSGDVHEYLCPHVYYPGQPNEVVEAKAKSIARMLDMKYMVRSLASGGAYNYAASTGLPSILIERGSIGLCPRSDIDDYKKDILRVMHALGMIEAAPEPPSTTPKDVRSIVYLEAPRQGCWLNEAECGSLVQAGQLLGRLRDFFCENEIQFTADHAGVLLYSCSALAAPKGTLLAAYGEVCED